MNQFKYVLTAAALAALVLAAACDEDEIKPADRCYYLPLAVGNRWVYQVERSEYGRDNLAPLPDLTIAVTAEKTNFQGYKKAYVLSFVQQGMPTREVTLGYNGPACYLFADEWLFLIEEGIPFNAVTETGLFEQVHHYRAWTEDITTPAGSFPACICLEFDYTEIAGWEWYKEDIGLVQYQYWERSFEPGNEYEIYTIYSLKDYELR